MNEYTIKKKFPIGTKIRYFEEPYNDHESEIEYHGHVIGYFRTTRNELFINARVSAIDSNNNPVNLEFGVIINPDHVEII